MPNTKAVRLVVEVEYGYGGELIHNIIDNENDELVAVVFAGRDVAEQMIENVENAHAFEVLEKL